MAANAAENQSADVIDLDKLTHVRESIKELETLLQKKQDASVGFNDGIKRVAEKAMISHKVLRRYITARVQDKLDDYHHQAEQMALLFDEI